jgi:hypothetical protein
MDERPSQAFDGEVSDVNNVNLEIREWWTGIWMAIWEGSQLKLSHDQLRAAHSLISDEEKWGKRYR